LLWQALMVTSCKKSANPAKQSLSANAVVLDKGNVAADGCGWQIMISDSLYSPLNLDAQFQVNNLKVHVGYHKLTTRFYCSQVTNDPDPGITQIQIDTIRTQ